ncbi:hypothetical protein BKA67DRAFT_687056 [Truncatella angustata]|uniref:Uncharacterized protein n=1 Tax=Truncatella angustata TaxID=152316 RepID=A0A9P9A3P7_9PEZI|nr:uncharacterized protein BKA67DRAFT_687056 [Truncatella angustata]KAH6660692.1 hypothetical protein BKA67DRAFT_687056 [Truncatella angustata]KAH8195048.1 hypothetical protein TruAng_010781 [Truncatella angustata]
MEPFALPVPSWRLGTQRKRKRNPKDEMDGSASPETDIIASSSRFPSDAINPRSHSPNTLRQFALAGLSPEEEVPSKIHTNFPHKGLPPNWQSGAVQSQRGRRQSRMSTLGSGSEADVDTDGESKRQSEVEMTPSSSQKFKHMNTMMAILHRCIHEGDIPRAKRAFSLLIRTKDVDIRLNEMWTLGTEILMRDGEERRDGHHFEGEEAQEVSSQQPPRWGSTNNIEKVRNYLETLAQYNPYDHHFPRSISAVDFWPALYSIEIYNIDAECRRALHRIDQSSIPADDSGIMSDLPSSQHELEEDHGTQTQKRQYEQENTVWEACDEVRHATQVAAQQIAARMDNLMQSVPYSTHIELLRLRGMLSLFIGDLYLPTRLLKSGSANSRSVGDRLQGLSLATHNTHGMDDRDAIRRREQEIEQASVTFERIVERGGQLEPWLNRYLDPDDDQASMLS